MGHGRDNLFCIRLLQDKEARALPEVIQEAWRLKVNRRLQNSMARATTLNRKCELYLRSRSMTLYSLCSSSSSATLSCTLETLLISARKPGGRRARNQLPRSSETRSTPYSPVNIKRCQMLQILALYKVCPSLSCDCIVWKDSYPASINKEVPKSITFLRE